MNDKLPATVTVIMLAWGSEPLLEQAAEAVLASEGVNVELMLVDNGCTTDAVERLRERPGVRVIDPGTNTGFAGGCNLGARAATGEFLAFINGDAIVDRWTLARLVGALTADVGLVTASLRLLDQPGVMNSAGNPVHFSGLSWAGGMGEPATEHRDPRDVASASGAATAVRADRYAALGGFCEPMFAYCEDTELSLRCWQQGWRVQYVPDAVVLHRYEFSRNTEKFYLLERNRLFLILTLYERRTLTVLAPALILFEAAVLFHAVRHGWWRQKLAGWVWLWRNRSAVRTRRHDVQQARRRSDGQLSDLLTGRYAPGGPSAPSAPRILRAGSRTYWALAKRCLARSGAPSLEHSAAHATGGGSIA